MATTKNKILVPLSLLGIAVGLGLCFFQARRLWPPPPEPPDHEDLSGEAAVVKKASELNATIVSPHLECEIPDNTNVLWCSTLQIAWNELCKLAHGPVRLIPEVQDANILSRQSITEDVIDPASYIAHAGFGPRALKTIRKELQKKFKGAARPRILPKGLFAGDLIMYAYLFQILPFEYAFTRFRGLPLEFAGKKVASFGIWQYLHSQHNEAQMAKQVLVYDFRSEEDFIVELIPKNRNHRIILAQIPPLDTLSSTIEEVQLRIRVNTPSRMMRLADLVVPIIDFDIFKFYGQLSGRTIKAPNPRINGQSFAFVLQTIRFRLDEKGTLLWSEAVGVGARTRNLIFQHPFLVMLQKHDSEDPYFALWIGNAELLTPFEREVKQRVE